MESIPLHQHRKISSFRPCAMLWDESLTWGIMARQTLMGASLPFDLLTSEDVRQGALSSYRMIFVPGGWASNKLEALGKEGQEEIRRFVEKGGSYFGICGGAGMATEEGIGLLPVVRKPKSERVPSFSGGIRLVCKNHTIWDGIDSHEFSVWWPSQFQIDINNINILAKYENPLCDAFSADINMEEGEAIGWSELELRYGILLNPARLRGEPAVLEGCYGQGKVILSLIHFDTPNDPNDAIVLRNIWKYLASYVPGQNQIRKELLKGQSIIHHLPPEIPRLIEEIDGAIDDLFNAGERNFLWYWRNPLLLHWRRGVRGMEYTTLITMIKETLKYIDALHSDYTCTSNGRTGNITELQLENDLVSIKERLLAFIEKAKRLLSRERFYLTSSLLSPLDSGDEEINRLRRILFASEMRHGGDFKCLIDMVDRLLFRLIK
ncbi:MAG: hypothetical protein CSYNP_03776 [Syntrophus sp. SKADARSKE-3]|nr:hypothetical protein [Syntrophus sp. SKADARSKE-3]